MKKFIWLFFIFKLVNFFNVIKMKFLVLKLAINTEYLLN